MVISQNISLHEFNKTYKQFIKYTKSHHPSKENVIIQQLNSVHDQIDNLTFDIKKLMESDSYHEDNSRSQYINERLYPLVCSAMITYSIHLGDEYDRLHSSSSTSTSSSTSSTSSSSVSSTSSSSSLNA